MTDMSDELDRRNNVVSPADHHFTRITLRNQLFLDPIPPFEDTEIWFRGRITDEDKAAFTKFVTDNRLWDAGFEITVHDQIEPGHAVVGDMHACVRCILKQK